MFTDIRNYVTVVLGGRHERGCNCSNKRYKKILWERTTNCKSFGWNYIGYSKGDIYGDCRSQWKWKIYTAAFDWWFGSAYKWNDSGSRQRVIYIKSRSGCNLSSKKCRCSISKL